MENMPHNRATNFVFQVISAIMAFLLICALGYGLIYSLVGMNATGADVVVGEVLDKTADDAITRGGPAIKNIANPAFQRVKTAAGGLLPHGTSQWGGVTINWDDITGGGGTIVNGTPVATTQPGGGQNPPTPAPVGCTLPNTPTSVAALQAWNRGDWETAVAMFNQTNARTDCLAEALVPLFSQFESNLKALDTAVADDNYAAFAQAARALIALNPQYREAYAALAYADANGLLTTDPLDSELAPKVLAGATITVIKIEFVNYVTTFTTDDDKATIKVAFTAQWYGEYTLTRKGTHKLEEALGQEKDSLMQEGAKYTVPGSFMPANPGMPVQPNGYDPSGNPIGGAPVATATQPTALPSPTPIPGASLLICTNIIKFVSETVPDGSVQVAGSTFVKSWTLQNAGTCTWTTGYSLVFESGEAMGGTSVALPNEVAPGQTVTISVTLTAPLNRGTYQGFWKLQDASGVKFGLRGTNPFWVKIAVR